jgi:hypothetical protein
MSIYAGHYATYERLIVRLKEVVTISQQRVTDESPDPLFNENLNFFTKAYLISLCTYLEAFLQDIAWTYVGSVKARIATAQIPTNVVRWCFAKDVKEKDLVFEALTLDVSRKDVADELSGNPGKTIALFRKIGVNLRSNSQFEACKEVVGSIVAKRNNIIHHNDSAADISLKDLLSYADQFLSYMRAIQACVSETP